MKGLILVGLAGVALAGVDTSRNASGTWSDNNWDNGAPSYPQDVLVGYNTLVQSIQRGAAKKVRVTKRLTVQSRLYVAPSVCDPATQVQTAPATSSLDTLCDDLFSCRTGEHIDVPRSWGVNATCAANQCNCPPADEDGPVSAGTGVTTTYSGDTLVKECPGGGYNKCDVCATGFYKNSNDLCVRTTCQCNNGAPATKNACHDTTGGQTWGSGGFGWNICAVDQCDSGYHYNAATKACDENICTCTTADGASTHVHAVGSNAGLDKCLTHGSTHCLSCEGTTWNGNQLELDDTDEHHEGGFYLNTTTKTCMPIQVCNAGCANKDGGGHHWVYKESTDGQTCTHYEAGLPTGTSDRVCATHDDCPYEQYESTAATPTSDRSCTPRQDCVLYAWSSWDDSACNLACSEGTVFGSRSRSRNIQTPSDNSHSKTCGNANQDTHLEETRNCNAKCCAGYYDQLLTNTAAEKAHVVWEDILQPTGATTSASNNLGKVVEIINKDAGNTYTKAEICVARGLVECDSDEKNNVQAMTGASGYSDSSGDIFCCGTERQSVSCTSCDAGTSNNKMGRGYCPGCDPGSWSLQQATTCMDCLGGTAQATSVARTALSSCVSCGVGQHSGPKATVCINCNPGYVSNETTATDPGDTSGQGCTACTAGYFSDTQENTCQNCDYGEYQESSAASDCDACTEGKANGNLASGVASDCQECGEGKFSYGQAENCQQCVAGKHNANQATTPGHTLADCVACVAGQYSSTPNIAGGTDGMTACTNCGKGKYSEGVGTDTDLNAGCTDCDSGKFSNTDGGNANAESVCTHCPNGVYCTAGAYGNAGDGNGVSNCPLGTAFTKSATQSAVSTGGYGADEASDCVTCLAGWAAFAGQASCTLCGTGKYQNQGGQEQCLLCPAGRENPNPNGNSLFSRCAACNPGKYQTQSGTSWCLDCPQGRYNTEYARNTTCTQCSAGWYGRTCKDKTGLACTEAGDSLETADLKVYKDGRVSLATGCRECPKGKWEDDPGQNGCVSCAQGTQLNATGSASDLCQGCSAGQYQPAPASALCIGCVAGKKGATGVTNAFYENVHCSFCDAGQFQESASQTTCVTCDAGMIGDALNRNTTVHSSSLHCSYCTAGEYQESAGQTTCVKCAAGKKGDAANRDTTVDLESEHCSFCDVGQYQETAGLTTCVNCVQGKKGLNDAGATAHNASLHCSFCAPGYFQESPGQITCDSCDPGMKGLDDGGATAHSESQHCSNCPQGQYQSSPGQTTCDYCQVGYFTGTANCNADNSSCTFTAGDGHALCKACPVVDSNRLWTTPDANPKTACYKVPMAVSLSSWTSWSGDGDGAEYDDKNSADAADKCNLDCQQAGGWDYDAGTTGVYVPRTHPGRQTRTRVAQDITPCNLANQSRCNWAWGYAGAALMDNEQITTDIPDVLERSALVDILDNENNANYPRPAAGRVGNPSDLWERQDCNKGSEVGYCPLDCTPTPWQPWETCNATCGDSGMTKRTRTILHPAQHGGTCDHYREEEAPCNRVTCDAPLCHTSHVKCKVQKKSFTTGGCSSLYGCKGQNVANGVGDTPWADSTMQCGLWSDYLLNCHENVSQANSSSFEALMQGHCDGSNPDYDNPHTGSTCSGFGSNNADPTCGNSRDCHMCSSEGECALTGFHSVVLVHVDRSFMCAASDAACGRTEGHGYTPEEADGTHSDIHSMDNAYHCERQCDEHDGTFSSIIHQRNYSVAHAPKLVDRANSADCQKCACYCSKHPPCDGHVGQELANDLILGNHWENIGTRQECCNMCTNHVQCGSFTYTQSGGHCLLFSGAPVFRPSADTTGTFSGCARNEDKPCDLSRVMNSTETAAHNAKTTFDNTRWSATATEADHDLIRDLQLQASASRDLSLTGGSEIPDGAQPLDTTATKAEFTASKAKDGAVVSGTGFLQTDGVTNDNVDAFDHYDVDGNDQLTAAEIRQRLVTENERSPYRSNSNPKHYR